MDNQRTVVHPINLEDPHKVRETQTQLPLFPQAVEKPMGYPPLRYQDLSSPAMRVHNWRDNSQAVEAFHSLRSLLDDYIANRRGSLTQEMVTAAIAGNHNKATVCAAQLNQLDSLLESLEMYMAQELAIRSASAFI